MKKHLALAIAAVLTLALAAPVFAQPFADVPAEHWAFDAIAELAAKGILEGYPDGTFKGDRAMTRYEMAMALARILARIEAIKIPPPPKIPVPDITLAIHRADITRLERLLNEFRAELSALGVRITALEEQLAAIKARLDNTRITGLLFFRYGTVPGAPAVAGTIGGAGTSSFGLLSMTFTGRVAPDAQAVVRLTLSDALLANVFFTSGAFTNPLVAAGFTTFDRAYIDVNYLGLAWRVGRQGYTLGPRGLLFEAETWTCGCGIDGLSVSGSAAGFNWSGGFFQGVAATFQMGRVAATLAGWTFGFSLYREWLTPAPGVAAGAANNGWQIDAAGNIVPGVGFNIEYASFTPFGTAVAQTAWWAQADIDLARFGMATYSPTLAIWYKQFGNTSTAVVGAWTPAAPGTGGFAFMAFAQSANLRAWGAQLNLTVSPRFRPYFGYEAGALLSNGAPYTAWEVGFRSAIARNTTARFRYQVRTVGLPTPAGTGPRYRLELTYVW